MDQSFNAVVQTPEGTESNQFDNFHFDMSADGQFFHDRQPGIGLELLETDADFFRFGINAQHLHFNFLTLLKHFTGVGDFLGPGQIAHMQQGVDTVFNLDKGTVFGQVAHNTLDGGADGIPVAQLFPGIGLGLFDAQSNLFFFSVNAQHHHVHFVADAKHFVWITDTACPAHFADMNHAFHAFFQLDKGAVFGHADNASAHDGAHRVPVENRFPRIFRALFESEADPLAHGVKAQHNNLNLITDLHHLRGMLDSAPAHVGHMQQTIDAPDVHKGAEVGNIFNFTFDKPVDFDAFKKVLFFNFTLLFEQSSAADNHIAATAGQLHNLDFHLFADVAIKIARGPEGQLAGGHEGIHTDIHFETALDTAGDDAFNNTVVVVYGLHMLPVFDPVRFNLGEIGGAVIIFRSFDIKIVCGTDGGAFAFCKFSQVNYAFAFVADIHGNAVIVDADNAAADDFAFFEILRRFLHQLRHAFLTDLLVQIGLQVGRHKVCAAPGQLGHQIFHETTRLLKGGWNSPRHTG